MVINAQGYHVQGSVLPRYIFQSYQTYQSTLKTSIIIPGGNQGFNLIKDRKYIKHAFTNAYTVYTSLDDYNIFYYRIKTLSLHVFLLES